MSFTTLSVVSTSFFIPWKNYNMVSTALPSFLSRFKLLRPEGLFADPRIFTTFLLLTTVASAGWNIGLCDRDTGTYFPRSSASMETSTLNIQLSSFKASSLGHNDDYHGTLSATSSYWVPWQKQGGTVLLHWLGVDHIRICFLTSGLRTVKSHGRPLNIVFTHSPSLRLIWLSAANCVTN